MPVRANLRMVMVGDIKVLKKTPHCAVFFKTWLRGLDLNQRPSGYEPDELPGCSTPR